METNREDHLMGFIKNSENNQPNQEQHLSDNKEYFGANSRQKVDKIEAISEWIEIPLHHLPYNKFYKLGTRLSIRAAKTKEIESFAVINEKNDHDVMVKINEMLSACCKIEYSDGTSGTYRDIQHGDRMTLIIMISKLSAKKSRTLQKTVSCSCKGEDTVIELIPANYEYAIEDEDIAEYFDANSRMYIFPLENGAEVKLAPPTIGMSEDIFSYVFVQTAKSGGKIVPNISFMTTIPYVKAGQGVKKMTVEQLEQAEYDFSKMNDEMFMFIYDVVTNKLDFGIKKVKSICKNCGEEVKADFGYPNGPRALFIVPDSFKQFIRQRVRVPNANSPTA